jgi:transposase
MTRGKPNKRYTGDFKQQVVEDVIKNKLSYIEAARKHGVTNKTQVNRWERIYLTEGAQALYEDRRGRTKNGYGNRTVHPPKFSKEVEEDLLKEVQRLRAENDYLKKLNALVAERVQREKNLKS